MLSNKIKHIFPLGKILLVGGLYLLLAKVCLTFSTVNGNATILWLPSGLALAATLIYGWRLWPGIFLGAYAAGILTGNPHWLSATIATGNTLEPIGAVWLLNRLGFDAKLDRLRDYFYLAVVALAAPLLSTAAGPTGLLLIRPLCT